MMIYTVMDLDVLEVASAVRSHPFLTSSLVLLFATPLFHVVLFFSPLLISTALCVVALVSIGPQIEKIREERERQFKLVGLSLPGVESERSPNRYLIFRRGRHRPPRGRGRGERWTNWVRGIEIRGQSIWLSSGSQLMSDIAEENLKADFRGSVGGIRMIEEDVAPGGALTFASAEDDLALSSNFQSLMQPFYDQIWDSSVFYNHDQSTIRSVKLENVRAAESESQTGSKVWEKTLTIAKEVKTSGQDDGLGVNAAVWGHPDKRRGEEEHSNRDMCLQLLKAGIVYPVASTSSFCIEDAASEDFERMTTNLEEVKTQKCYKKQPKLAISESTDHNDRQNPVCPETSEEKAPFSLCGCFKRRRLFGSSKTSREIKLKQKEQKSCV